MNQIKSLYVLIMLCLYTANACIRCIVKCFFNTPSRAWVDKTLHHWVNQLLAQAQVQYRVINPNHIVPLSGKPTILMCNHSSAFDIPLIFKAFPTCSIRMLAKKELSRVPILGQGMTKAEFPFIDRKNRYQAIKDLDYVQKLMKSGIVIWIAPEGTRSHTGTLAPFKKGAFITAIQANAIIIPIGIRGAFNILPAQSMQVHYNQHVEIHIGQPIDASQYTLDNKEALITRTFVAIKNLTGEHPIN